MKTIYIVLSLSIISLGAIAQNNANSKLNLIQGIWENTKRINTERSYKIIKGTKSIGISHMDDYSNLDFYLNESLVGFQNNKYDEVDSINTNAFTEYGKYFTSVIYKDEIHPNGWVRIEYCIIPEYFECNGENMSVNGGQLVEFVKIGRLQNTTIRLLYLRGKRDKRNYIKEYIGADVKEIKDTQSPIYSKPGIASKISLLRGTLVTILEEKGEWCKIEFELANSIKLGWIKKSCLED